MATQLQDLQAKRKELQATNPNATMLDAKNALAPAISNAPVAGVAPAFTNPVGQTTTAPTAPVAPVSVHDNANYQSKTTEQYNQGVLAKNKAKVQSEIQAGTRPAVGTQATPAQTPEIIQQAQTQTEQANAPAPTTVTPSVATETTKAQPTPEQTPQTAIAPITPKAQKVTAPVTTITPPSPRDIAVNNKLNQYSAMSSQQFVDLMKQGQIPSSISSQLATTNPQFQQAQQEYSQFLKTNNINTSGKAVYNAMTGGQTEQAVNPLEAISNSLLKAFGVEGTQPSYLDAFKESIAQNDAIKTKTLELNAKQAEIDQKVQARDNILKDYKKQYNGVPLSTLIAMAARDAQPINDEITTLQRDVAQLSSDLKFETELAKGEYDAKVKDMEAKTGIRNTILGNLMNAQFGLATKQMEAQMAEQIAKQAFNDPMKAIPAMIDEYKKLGIPFERSTQEIVADFQASGQDLASYLTDLQKTVQSKPEYQRYKQLQAGQMTDMEKMMASQKFELGKMGMEQAFQMKLAQAKQTTDNKWTKLDDGLYTNQNGEIITADELKNAKLLGNSYITKGIGEEGGECGFYASRATGMSSTPGGNSKEARIKAFSDTTPQVGGMAFFGGAGYDPTYGHISIVTGVNADGTITVKDSNYNGDKKVGERTVPANSVTGYYNNTPLAKGVTGQGATGTEYSDQNISDLAYLVELQEKNPTQASKEMKELGYTSRDLANYKGGNVPLTDRQKQSSINLANSIKDLLTNYDYTDATGFHFFDEAPRGSDWASAEEKIKTIVANMTLPNLGMLKGPMSDKDLAFIQAASSNLATSQSDATFGKQLLDAYNLAARRAGLPEAKTLNDIKKETTTVTATGAGQTVSGNKGTYTW